MAERITYYRAATKKFLVYGLLYLLTGGIILSTFILTPTDYEGFPLLRAIIIGCASILLFKYFVYMFISPWYDVLVMWRLDRGIREAKSAAYEPRVSVLIPAWNEG